MTDEPNTWCPLCGEWTCDATTGKCPAHDFGFHWRCNRCGERVPITIYPALVDVDKEYGTARVDAHAHRCLDVDRPVMRLE